ncbi:oskyddad [Carabus blaptoides fortunei]
MFIVSCVPVCLKEIDTMTAANSAVYVKNAYKHYGPKSGPRHNQVLDGLCMEVQRGSIYGLLGASGCGKTTLLSCIVGRRMLNSGELWVLGGSPGSEGSGVPGPRIGYMPQEIALVGEFSIRGVVKYFGRIVGMTDEKIDARWGELRELLDLPPDNRRVADCSGGQQRRVSLAAALVHDPELLILDEPTVGLDPVLREKIWNYFVEITTKKNISVIITTHYIEECRYAHRIGLMRQGKLMAEESPQALISRFRTDTLEEVFLNLSIRQTESTMGDDPELGHVLPVETGSVQSLPGDSINDVSVLGTGGSTDMLTKPTKGEKRRKVSPFSINPKRLGALFYKNWYQYFTNVSGVAFMILFPFIHMSVFFLAVGGDPIDLPVAFVNDENGTCAGFKMENSLTFLNETDCEFRQMSLSVYTRSRGSYDTKDATIERVQEGRFVSDSALDMSEIKVWLDMSNRQVGPPIQAKLLKKYIEFTKSMLRDCKRNPQIGEIPLNFHDAIYGSVDDSFTLFLVPGLLVTVIYFLATMMTSTVIISDRLEGVWDRTLVAEKKFEVYNMDAASSSTTLPMTDIALRRKQLKSQQSTVSSRRQQAVCVRRAHKSYGPKKNANIVLDSLNMTVPKGSIYGLLGASGCGKTTLLSCIVGRRRLDSGEIWVLGGKPGSRGSGVPGPRIGYMPQDIALYGEFSIRETLLYFGWVCGMTTAQIDEKLDFLIKFLMLPSASRPVKNLSGGQQRRVSFAAALVHDPELLILDEPTVGVDPVLRQNIWDYLVQITKGGNKTIIITTHYIDETKQATVIGLMRGGYFLAEESPERLMQQWGAESLEDVFLKLSVIQNMGKRRRSSIAQDVIETIRVPSGAINDAAVIDDELGEISGEFGDNISMSSRGAGRRVSLAPDDITESPPELPPDDDVPVKFTEYFHIISLMHLIPLIWKNFLWMWRNVPVMAFIVLLPVTQIVLFCYTIGHDPKGLALAVVNYEVNTSIMGCPQVFGCNTSYMSCRYLRFLEEKHMVVNFVDTEDEAQRRVDKGKAWAALVFPANYSESFSNRIDYGRSTNDWDVDYSIVDIYQDKSNQQVAHLMWRDFNYAFINYAQDYLTSCNFHKDVAKIPVRFNQPIYGDKVPNFTDFAAPGVILTIIFFLAVALTSGAMLLERNEGSLERSLVIGITGVELLFSHVITQFVGG